MKTKYLEFISESRYKTYGVDTIRRTLPKVLNYMNAEYKIFYNPTDDFSIYFTNITNGIKDVLITRCELIGYFPSTFKIDGVTKSRRNHC